MGAVKALLASQNDDKLRELTAALPGWELSPLDADDYPPESGSTYLENARGKAVHGRRFAPDEAWVLGEDSGIEVEALSGAPGVESARWAGGEHVARLLDALAGAERRGARYVCELVAVAADGREVRGRGVLPGRIATEPRGTGGFGFDPIFVPDGETSTVAELGDAWKTQHSHRARAARSLAQALPQASPGAPSGSSTGSGSG
jgi:XTP/dITP diphosphohydrolase